MYQFNKFTGIFLIIITTTTLVFLNSKCFLDSDSWGTTTNIQLIDSNTNHPKSTDINNDVVEHDLIANNLNKQKQFNELAKALKVSEPLVLISNLITKANDAISINSSITEEQRTAADKVIKELEAIKTVIEQRKNFDKNIVFTTIIGSKKNKGSKKFEFYGSELTLEKVEQVAILFYKNFIKQINNIKNSNNHLAYSSNKDKSISDFNEEFYKIWKKYAAAVFLYIGAADRETANNFAGANIFEDNTSMLDTVIDLRGKLNTHVQNIKLFNQDNKELGTSTKVYGVLNLLHENFFIPESKNSLLSQLYNEGKPGLKLVAEMKKLIKDHDEGKCYSSPKATLDRLLNLFQCFKIDKLKITDENTNKELEKIYQLMKLVNPIKYRIEKYNLY